MESRTSPGKRGSVQPLSAYPKHTTPSSPRVSGWVTVTHPETRGDDGVVCFGYADKGCTLPLFPGDVRDSICSPPGGPESPLHLHRSTLPRFFSASQFGDASNVVASACAASRCCLEGGESSKRHPDEHCRCPDSPRYPNLQWCGPCH